MREGFAIFLAVVVSATAAACLGVLFLWLWLSMPSFDSHDLVFSVLFAFSGFFACSMLIGIPTALALKHKNRFRLAPMTVAGFIAGVVPGSLLISAIIRGIQPDDLAAAALLVIYGGLIGAAGGASFFCAHRLMSPNNSFKPKPLRGAA